MAGRKVYNPLCQHVDQEKDCRKASRVIVVLEVVPPSGIVTRVQKRLCWNHYLELENACRAARDKSIIRAYPYVKRKIIAGR